MEDEIINEALKIIKKATLSLKVAFSVGDIFL